MLPNDRQVPPLRRISESKRPPAAIARRFGIWMSEDVFRFFLSNVMLQQVLHVSVGILVEIPDELDKNDSRNADGRITFALT